MNPLGIIVDIGCVNIVNKYQQKLFFIYLRLLFCTTLVLIAVASIHYL